MKFMMARQRQFVGLILGVIVAFVFPLTSLWGAEKNMTPQDQFNQRFKPLKEVILDKGSYFSLSKMKKDLEAIEPLAKQVGLDSKALCDWYSMYTLVLSKKLEGVSAELVKRGEEYMWLFKDSPCMTDEALARLYYRLSHAYEYEGNFPDAIENQEHFISLGKKAGLLPSASLILGQKQQLAYLLAENKEPAEALKINLSVKKQAKDSDISEKSFFTVYNNIAQNYYDLGDFTHAEEYLDKRLDISRKYKNFEVEQNTLFQKAVLAFEKNQFKRSKDLFTQRLKLAKERKDELKYTTIEDIERDLKTYYKRMNKVKSGVK